MTHDPLELPETLVPHPHQGKDEMNFAEFPIALLTDRVPKGQKFIEFADEIYDHRRKKTITRRRIIEGSEKYGLPTATDDAVILALIQLTKIKGNFTKRDVEFSRLELIKMLGWPNEGKNYDRIKLSLLRIANVTYNYDNAWWDTRQKTWTTKAFHIIDTVEINDSRASGGQAGLFPSRIVWGDVVFESFQSGFLRNIDFQLCMRLEHPTALRMYRFLGKRFYQQPDWLFDLKEFAYEHMGLGRNYEGGTQIARKLKPAVAELEAVGFLETLPENERFIKKGRNWSIRFVQKLMDATVALPVSQTEVQPKPSGLAVELTARGVTASTAEDMIRHYPGEMIAAKIDIFDWLASKQDKRVAKNPAGWLVKAISEDYAAPKGFVSTAERQRQDERKQASERDAVAEQRRKRQEEAQEKAEKERAAAYWASLTDTQQAEIDAASLALADPQSLEVEHGPFGETMRRLRRDAFIRNLLKQREPESAN